MMQIKLNPTKRTREITDKYLEFLDNHLNDILDGTATEMMPLKKIATSLYISHSHLSDTIKQTTGKTPCFFYDYKIIEKAKTLLIETTLSVAGIARILSYDPSNFSKFFKKSVCQSPGGFRKNHKKVTE